MEVQDLDKIQELLFEEKSYRSIFTVVVAMSGIIIKWLQFHIYDVFPRLT